MPYSYVNDKTNLIEIGQQEEEDLDADDELLELRKETWIDMTIFDEDNKPSVDRGSGQVYDLDEATDMGSYDTNVYAKKRETRNGRNVMGLAAMLAEANMRSNVGAGDQEENLEREMDSDEGDENGTDEIMGNTQNTDDTEHLIPPPQGAGTAGFDIAADGSPPTASAQSPPAKAVVEAQE